MNSTERLQYFSTKIAEFQDLKKKLGEELAQEFEPLLKAVLIENDFPYIVMAGYTPSFNDGDICEFEIYLDFDADRLSDVFEDTDFSNIKQLTKEQEKNCRGVEKTFLKIQDILQEALGDGWEIIAGFDASGEFHYNFNDEYDCGY
jgi:hypothetical protein